MENFNRILDMMGTKVKVDNVNGYLVTGYVYYHSNYFEVTVSILCPNTGEVKKFNVESWRVTDDD
jgi:hypothetical protein